MRPAVARLASVTALLTALLACGAVLSSCARTGDSRPDAEARSRVPGIELVHTPGPVAAWSRPSRYAAAPQHDDPFLYLLSDHGGRPRRVGQVEVHDGPIWSPDGHWLVFSTTYGKIERVHPDGRGRQTIAEFEGEEVEWLAFSPDGRRLLYSAHPPFTGSD